MIAALFVETGGCYWGIPGVDPWDEARDARKYDGPHRIVGHPPCGPWSMLAAVVEAKGGRKRGDDGGTFRAAVEALIRCGGVIEHPAGSRAFAAHGLPTPPPHGKGWGRDPARPRLWVCSVDQSCYGHVARKRTWLAYYSPTGYPPPELDWRDLPTKVLVCGAPGQDRHARRRLGIRLMRKADRIRTPRRFRDLLLRIAWESRR